jgi:adenosylhomocysteinase
VHLVQSEGQLERRVHAVPLTLEREVARIKLDSLGVEIDELTPEQAAYLSSWDRLGR